MSVRLHLAESCEPIVQGSTVRAMCGTEVQFAAAVRIPDSDEMLTNCRRCWQAFADSAKAYKYLIQNAQEAKLEGSDA